MFECAAILTRKFHVSRAKTCTISGSTAELAEMPSSLTSGEARLTITNNTIPSPYCGDCEYYEDRTADFGSRWASLGGGACHNPAVFSYRRFPHYNPVNPSCHAPKKREKSAAAIRWQHEANA